MRATLARVLATLLLALLPVGVLASPAAAHAELTSSSPADGANLDESPGRLLLRFTESVEIDRTSVTLRDADGHRETVGRPVLVGAAAEGTESPVTVAVRLPELARGTYHLEWRSLSSDDLHETYGTVVFGVDTRVSPAGTGSAGLGFGGLVEAAVRWLGFAGLAAALGGLALWARNGDLPVVRRRLPSLVHRGATVAFGGALAGGALAVSRSGFAAAEHALGARWTGQVLALGALTLAALALRRRADAATGTAPARRGGPTGASSLTAVSALTAAAALAAVVATSLSGHGVAAGGTRGAVLVAVHLVSTATWAGGVALLAVLLLGSRRAPEGSVARFTPAATSRLLRRFAIFGVPGFVLSTVSGLLLAGVLVPSSGALTGSGYGRTLLLKVLLVGAAGALGARTAIAARRGARSPARRSRHRFVTVEALALLGAVAGAALLSAQSPPTTLRWAPDAGAASAGVHTRPVDDLIVTATVAPNRPGANFLTVGVFDTRRPAPAPVTGVDLLLRGDGIRARIEARATEHQTWVANSDVLDRSGPWLVTVVAHRPGYPDARTTFRWTLRAMPGTERGGAPLGERLDILAWTLLGVSVAICGARAFRRRPDRPAVGAPHPPTSGLPGPPGLPGLSGADDGPERSAAAPVAAGARSG